MIGHAMAGHFQYPAHVFVVVVVVVWIQSVAGIFVSVVVPFHVLESILLIGFGRSLREKN
jgi:hypothetical protein